MKIQLLLAFTGLCLWNPVLAQDDEPNPACALQPQNKKVAKTYPKVLSQSTPEKERIELLKQAVQTDPECAVCYFHLGSIAWSYAQSGDASYARAKEYFGRVYEICPDFHAEVLCGLALIAMDEGQDDVAIDYLQRYVAFKNDDASRYGNSYDEKRKWAKDQIEELKYWKDYFTKTVPFDPKPVKNVASAKDEYVPMLSPDNELIFYTRKLEGNQRENVYGDVVFIEQLTQSVRSGVQSDFDGGKPVGGPFDDKTFTSFGGVTLSVDNHEMIVCGCKKEEVYEQIYTNCDLYSSKYQQVENPVTKQMEYKWSPLKNLGPMVNTPDGWESTPTLSGDGQSLYFTTFRAGMKDYDIMVSKRNDKGRWGMAKPAEGLNSNGDEKSPYMHADSRTMYFVSGPSASHENSNPNYQYERRGVGGFDIYFAKQNDDGSWSKPRLMAYPINSESDEVGIIVSTDGHTAYFASNRNNSLGGQDIFSFNLYEEARPDKVVLVKGEVKNESGKGDTTAVVEITKKNAEGVQEKTQVKVNESGTYAAVVSVKPNDEILVKAKKQGAFIQTQVIQPKEINQTFVKGSDFVVEPMKVGKAYTVDDILFNTASYDLLPESFVVLDQFVEFLQENPGVKVEVQGHTDNEGVASKNKVLSENRARVVKEYLQNKGIDASRLSHVGYGQEQPKVPNTTPENKAKNRRTDFKILAI
jgi:outer membrane protein OmpA-like peptidoglycan-associated protein